MSRDTDVRDLLARMAEETGLPQLDPQQTLRRARRRVLRTLVVSSLVVLVAVPSAVVGVRALLRAPTELEPIDPPSLVEPSPSPDREEGSSGIPTGAPSRPAVGEMLASVWASGELDGADQLYVYTDGRIVWKDTDRTPTPYGGWFEQTITPEGAALIHSEILATGLFEHGLRLDAGHHRKLVVEARNGDRVVMVGSYGDVAPGEFQKETPGQANDLERLESILVDPIAWLPDDAVIDAETRPFIAPRYGIYLTYVDTGLGVPAPRPADLPDPVADLLRSAERAGNYGSCQIVSVDEMFDVARRLEEADSNTTYGMRSGSNEDNVVEYDIAYERPVLLGLYPALPHETACSP